MGLCDRTISQGLDTQDMTDPNVPESSETLDDTDEPSPFRIALGFFILPLLMVAAGIGLFMMFGVLAHDNADPGDYLPALSGNGINEPWQAAFHLSQQLQYNEQLIGDAEFTGQVVDALQRADGGDPRVRRFLSIALGRLEHPSAVPVLMTTTRDEDSETRVNATWALGVIGDPSAATAIVELLDDDVPAVRTMAAYVLGVLANPTAERPLRIALNDTVPAVRWNAAVALAMLGHDGGLETLQRMIDRDHLSSVPGVNAQDHGTTMLAALRAMERLGAGGFEDKLTDLRDTDPDLRIREAARRVLSARQGSVARDVSTLLAQEQYGEPE